MKKFILACLLALGAAGIGNAATYSVGTVEALQDAFKVVVDGDTIMLLDTITMTAESNDIRIPRRVRISGGDSGQTIEGGGFPIFSVADNVSFDKVTFTGAVKTGSGGAVSISSGIVNFRDSTFTENSATTGGAVNIAGGTVTFTGSTFTGNRATGNGGAVSVTGGEVRFTSGSFSRNNAMVNGGAVSVATGSLVNFNNVSFGGPDALNTAATGGAVHVAGGTVTFNGGSFAGNSATGNGGAVNVAGGSAVNFISVSFGNADAVNTATAGGAVYIAGGTVAFNGGTFARNSATGNGGAVYVAAGNPI
ncbi:MAG: hypothetical protein LBQ90_10340, partial [Synergistaceae bacterium]|nr:hypothetical protein [Synergistaceae bacterium]